ncbi:FAD-dependent oxidoreductase [Duganella sp. FT92W]|uniref:FAD-dependent oxidoreductase n=1 Tax=Pseudoduganella rivuli TaxID=2666085 RepID=A0A7X2IPV1_9BURK|nr:FAD-binding oxidoreductase [Pseudoduganella rivuli]MRV73826.1 FAD-dependent oxidoreductase [Pseudoduganella rivuli]
MNTDVLIIGAGIIGAACAEALAARGVQVTIVEQDAIGSGATAAGMGHLVVMDDNAAELALSSYSLALWREFVGAAPARHEYSRCGTIWVAADDEEMDAARAKGDILRANGIDCTLLNAVALYEREPALRPGLAGGLLVSGDGLVYPPKSARLLLERAMANGTQLVMGKVASLLHDGVTTAGVLLADGRELRADTVVLACGSRSAALVPELPVQPKKGHVAITDRYPGFIRHQLVELGYIKSAHAASGDSVAFNLQPRPTGQILIGSSRQFGTEDLAVEPAMMARMLRHAASFTPALAGLNLLRCWTGMRAASPDGLPLIGPHPARPGLWLATGHEGLGITTSLATAHLLASQLLNDRPAIAAEPYLPARFTALANHGGVQ